MVLRTLVTASLVGCGAAGGVFFAFSAFVMPALARLAPAAGASAMQSINVTAVRPPLMILLFGTAAVCAAASVVALVQRDRGSVAVLVGTAVYLVGAVGVTAALNVPLNDKLAAVTAPDAADSGLWAHYLRSWTAANHVRAFAGMAAAAVMAAAR